MLKTKIALYLSVFFFFQVIQNHAQTAEIKGKITDESEAPIAGVSVFTKSNGVFTDDNGEFKILIPSNISVNLTFSHISFETHNASFKVSSGKSVVYNTQLKVKEEEIEEVIVRDDKKISVGSVSVKTETIKNIPGANSGVENVLKTLPGVNFNNELSTLYNVRGGSFEENLVYVNGIEVYRPFLVRSAEQEGLSFVNSQMTENVVFSTGGFQAKYGDKLSSALDISYRKPEDFGLRLEASLLGASATVEGLALKDKMQVLVGMRYRNNSLFIENSETESNFYPVFTDIQSYLNYQFSDRLLVEFLGTYGQNTYEFTPYTRRTNFGTVTNPLALVINYEGKEEDNYTTLFGALKGTYVINDAWNVQLITSAFDTQEEEYYDIIAAYGLGNANTDFGSDDFGEVKFLQSVGQQQDHARNDLKANIYNAELRTNYRKNQKLLEVGVKFQREDITDRVIEWQMVDSAGFAVRPPYMNSGNNEPYEPFTDPIIPYISIRAYNEVQTDRYSGFAQFSDRITSGDNIFWYNLGVRAQHWSISGKDIISDDHTVFGPRGQIAWKPASKNDMVFRLAGGWYYQPPFYRELRDSLGLVHPEVKAQEAIHFVVGNDYSFKMWDRPFKLTTEAYYKHLTDVNPFTIDNVRIRYRAKNNAVAYATGFDVRLNGEFVPGTESWFSFGYLLTEENIDDRGYISRPTDQRLKFAVLFQDYIPNLPSFKMYLNMVYNTGVPGGSPSYADPYLYQNRLDDYFRADIGLSYVFVDVNNRHKNGWLSNFKELSAGIELFNMFDVQNSITNTWVTDISTQQSIAVPNYLSPRIINVKLAIQL